jgi:subtilisin family serine protease
MDIRLRVGRRLAASVVAVGLGAVPGVLAGPAAATPSEPTASYVVAVRDPAALPLAHRFGARVEHTYGSAFTGFSARLSQSEVKRLAADPAVAYVAPDTPVSADGSALTTGSRVLGEQPDPPSWGLDRIDQRTLPLDRLYRFPTEAETVTAYVIDTGIRASHRDFGGRVAAGPDFVDDDGNPDDGNGHGTFIAGIIGGTAHGVAKRVTLVPVRVLNNAGSGTIADVIAGINWVTANARKPAVVNMSLGGPANQALDDAVRASIASGVTYVVPAGSSASDAGGFSPARVREAITTAATRMDDCVFPPSNFGPLIDLYAPGQSVTSTWITSDTATITISGTSFSSSHVVGGAALLLAARPTLTPAQVAAALVRRSTGNVLCNVPPGTANRLLYTGP